MKKVLLSLCVVVALFCTKGVEAQTKITDFPTYIGNPAGGWMPIVINGINRKIDATLVGYNKLDSFSIGIGTTVDTFYLWKLGAIAFYQTYTHNGGGGGGISNLSLIMPTGFTVSPSTLHSDGTFTVTTGLNGIIHASGGGFSGGQIIDADVHDINFPKITNVPTTKSGLGLTDVMTYPDTIALSNRINLRVRFIDTSAMLAPYLRKTDTISLSNRFNTKLNLTDTSAMLSPYFRKADTVSFIGNVSSKLNISDTSNMLSVYLRKKDTATLSTRINGKVNISDTSSMLSVYLRKSDTVSLNNRVALKVNYTDTSNMLLPYLRKSDTLNMLTPYLRKIDTASLSTRINLKVNISDTSFMLSKYLRKTDTTAMLTPYLRTAIANNIFYPLGTNPLNYYKPTDTSGLLATQYYVSQHGSIYTAGYGMGLNAGAFFVDTSNNKIATQNYVNAHAGIIYSAGSGLTLNGTIFKADTSLLATQYDNGLKLNKTDTSSMLSPYVRTQAANNSYYPLNVNPKNYLITIDTSNIPSFSVKTRSLFSAGTGLTYNPATGLFINTITNTNQLTNGAGFINGINSSAVTTALGYTPINPNGTSTQYIKGNGVFASFAYNNLTDVTVTSPSNGQLMNYSTGLNKWINFTPSFYQPTDTITTLATKTNIVKDTVVGFQVGDGGTYTPSNGTNLYTNPLLQFAQLISITKDGVSIPTFPISGGGVYASFNATSGIVSLHNAIFTTNQVYSVQYAFGNGAVAGGGGGGGGSVTSVFGRSGAVVGQLNDYSSFFYQIPTGTTAQYIRADGSFATFPTLSTVATTGAYGDLTGKPTIPTNTNQLTNGAGFITGITLSNVTTALGYVPLNASGSAIQYIKGDGTFATSDTSMIPNFFLKVRSEFTAGTGIGIVNGIITNTINNTNQLTNGAGFLTSINSGNVTTALGFTPVNQATTISINGTSFDLSGNRTYNIPYANLADVNLTSIADGQLVKYNNSTGKWINFTPGYLSSVDTGNISNFYIKVRSLSTAGTGISITNGVFTNTITNTNQLTNGAGFLTGITSSNVTTALGYTPTNPNGTILQYVRGNGTFATTDTSMIPNFFLKVRSEFGAAGGGLSYNTSSGIFTTDTTSTLATQNYVLTHSGIGSIASVAGTTNQISSSTTSGAVTLSLPSNVHIAGTLFVGGTSGIQFGDNGIGGSITGFMQPLSDGVFLISNSGANGFGRLILGGATTAFPSIARNAAGIDIKLGDNSGYTTIQASSFIKNGGTSVQYLMGDGSVSTITQGSGILFSGGVIKADTTTAITGLTTLYKDGLKVKYTDTSSMLSAYARSFTVVKYSDTATMLTPYARKAFLSALSPILYNNSTGVFSADTTNVLATQYDLNNTFDTVRVVPYGTTGVVLVRSANDSIRPKNLIAGTNITLTQNNDSTITIASSGSGGSGNPNSNIGTGNRWAIPNSNNIKTVFGTTNQIGIDSTTNTNALTFSLPSTVSITNLTTSGIVTSSGTTYAIGSLTPKLDVIVQDTTTNILYRRTAQFIDTSGIAIGKIVYWNGTSFAMQTNSGGAGSVQSVATGLGLSGGPITNTGTIIADTSYLATKSSAQVWSGNKVFSGILSANSTVNLNGTTYAPLSLNPKLDVVVKDTTTGQLYQRSAQFLDTSGRVNNSTVVWNNTANSFVVAAPGSLPSTFQTSTLSSLTLTSNVQYNAFTGSSATTWTLPSISGNSGTVFYIKNRGTASITLQRAGSDQLYTTSAVTSVSITAGSSAIVWNDGSFWIVQ